ncbi:MAG: phosphoglycolate phosphatase [Rhodospirillales bacterium]|nr:phosphoglycolate phosphatase [Rhodospirillales bacterium]
MNFPSPSLPAAVVFDLDGTLIDSAPDLHAALNRLMATEGRRQLALGEVIAMIGDGVPTLVERGYRATGEVPEAARLAERVETFSADYENHATDQTVLFAGVLAALDTLRASQVLLGICTNKPQAATLAVLRFFGLADRFDAVVGGDQLAGIRKPDARHLLATMEKLGVGADQTVMVGDSPNDIGVAINAGVPSIAVSFGYSRVPVPELGANRTIDHFDDLVDALVDISLNRGKKTDGRL